eukprot:COSAG02_NODE_6227_length_3714_cov_1.599447_5_plen_60_part_00
MARGHLYGDGWYYTTDNKDSWHKVGGLTVVADVFSSLGYGPVSPYLLWCKHWPMCTGEN